MGTTEVAAVDVGIGEKEGEPDFLELVSAVTRVVEEAVEERKGFVEAALITSQTSISISVRINLNSFTSAIFTAR